ncbi:MAG: alpha-L-rhamnosidase C-terminal domain-containing protein, partial [Monoglobales bacterium]
TESEYDSAYKKLLELIREKQDHVFCGLVGLRYIFHVLLEKGDGDLALKMITRPDAPSYGSMIARGATTLCESLEQSTFSTSENHHFFGDIINLFISKFAGIQINPNLKNKNEFLIRPCFVPSLDFAEASYVTELGEVKTRWEKQNDEYIITVNIPDGICGNIVINDRAQPLPAGESIFRHLLKS